MKRVGVREFRDHATKYLAGDEVLSIERHGKEIGVYIPTKARATNANRSVPVDGRRQARIKEAADRLGETVQQVLEETGLTEDELADFFDLSKPAPELPRRRSSKQLTATHAAGR